MSRLPRRASLQPLGSTPARGESGPFSGHVITRYPDAVHNFPQVGVNFVFGGTDNGPSVPQALEWVPQITDRVLVTVSWVTDAPHSIPDVLDGTNQIEAGVSGLVG